MPLFKTLHDTHGIKFKSLGKAPSLICLLPSSRASFLLLPISHTGEELPAVPWVLFYFPSSNFYRQFPQWNAFLPLISPAPQHALAAPETFPSFSAELKLSFFSESFLIVPEELVLTSLCSLHFDCIFWFTEQLWLVGSIKIKWVYIF